MYKNAGKQYFQSSLLIMLTIITLRPLQNLI